MKKASLSYHDQFPISPMTGWAGPGWGGWVNKKTPSGQWMTPRYHRLPYLSEKRRWCQLHVHFRGVDLIFSLPDELDQFIDVMSQRLLPSGHRLVAGNPVGRPNRHWLSRLPKKAKPWKFRSALCAHLLTLSEAEEFRAFYQDFSVESERRGYHRSFHEAIRARQKPRKL